MTRLEVLEKQLRQLEKTYRPRGHAAEVIGKVILVNGIGPSGAGKSTVNKIITEVDPQFSVPLGITTRDPRKGEKLKAYRHIPHTAQGLEEVLHKAQAGDELVQFTFHKTSGRLYGTEVQDYTTRYAVLDMQYDYAEQTHGLGFEDVIDIAIVSSVRDYARHAEDQAKLIGDPDEMEKRRQESILCLKWCLARKDHIAWVHNRHGQADKAALEVIALARKTVKPNHDNWRLGAQMLEYLKSKPFRSIG